MGFSTLALLIGISTAQAHATQNHACNNRHAHVQRNRRPNARPNGHWVWVPRYKVRHKNHWHVVPGHWEYRSNEQRRKKWK